MSGGPASPKNWSGSQNGGAGQGQCWGATTPHLSHRCHSCGSEDGCVHTASETNAARGHVSPTSPGAPFSQCLIHVDIFYQVILRGKCLQHKAQRFLLGLFQWQGIRKICRAMLFDGKMDLV